MAAAVGIHLGCTSASLAICKDGKAEIIANDAGDRVTPALVACSGIDMSVGLPAKHGLIRNAKNTMARASKIIGLRFTDSAVQQEVEVSTSKIVDKDGEPYFEVDFNGKSTLFSPKDVVKMVLQKMLETAQAHCGSDILEGVITVPLHYSDEQLTAIRQAAQNVGFHILRVISQPAAAVLAYDVGQSDRTSIRRVLVYRLGGSSFCATVLIVNGGIFRVLATEFGAGMAGDSFDELLVHHLATEFRRQWKLDVTSNTRAMAKLGAAAESCKHVLSSRDSATCSLESLFEGIDFQCTISRARFESLCSSLFQQSLAMIDRVLSVADVSKQDIDQVILVGGSTRIPRIQQLVQECFPDKEMSQSISPDGVISYGAALQASLIQGREGDLNDNLHEVDCTSQTISVSLEGTEASLSTIIPKYSPIPLRRTHTFTTSEDNQKSVCLCVYEVQEETSNSIPRLVAKVVLEDIPSMAKGEAKIVGTFHIRRDGSLHIHLVEKSSEKSADITVEAS